MAKLQAFTNIQLKEEILSESLTTACLLGAGDCIKILVSTGVNVNVKSVDGKTPLMFALQHTENLEIVDLLLSVGANVNDVDQYGQSAFMLGLELWECQGGYLL